MDIRYDAEAAQAFTAFRFQSVGPNGTIKKFVKFKKIKTTCYKNLGFGDEDPETGEVNDATITNNGDSKKILATVAWTVSIFMDSYPESIVFFTGNSSAKTRLYQMGISNNLEAIRKEFTISGFTKDGWQPFQKGVNYSAFLVHRNSITL